MKVTIACNDISVPLPPMAMPDLPERIVTVLIERLAARNVSDLHRICATALRRPLTADELELILGPRIFAAFWPDRLYKHDAEDRTRIVSGGRGEHGEEIELNRRAVESDLLILVNIQPGATGSGHDSVAIGHGAWRSRCHPTESGHRWQDALTDPGSLETVFAEGFAREPRNIELDRRKHASHGVHPFEVWYRGCLGRELVGEVIVAHPRDTRACRMFGWKTAHNVAEAIAMARARLGNSATTTHFQLPPLVLADVV